MGDGAGTRRDDPRRGSWRRWLLLPWSSAVLLTAITLAAAAPAALVVIARAWQQGAEDTIARQVVAGADPATNGVDVRLEVRFDGDPLDEADRLLRARTDRLPGTTPVDLTLYTLPAGASSSATDQPIGTPVRIVARAGAFEAVDVVERGDDPASGIWVSRWFSDRYGLGVGDPLRFTGGFVGDVAFNDIVPGLGTTDESVITAVYETLWDTEGTPPNGYWADVAPELVPRYLAPLNGPSATLVLADPERLAASGLTGVARWTAPATELPTTVDGLRRHGAAYREFETALVRGTPLAPALQATATGAGRLPVLTTDLFETVAAATDAADGVGAPLRGGLGLGLALSALVLAATGVFLVERRRQEFRLLAAGGDRWVRLGARVSAQGVAPAVLGVVGGAGIGLVVARTAGPGAAWRESAVPWGSLALLGVVVAGGMGIISGFIGQAVLAERSDARRRTLRAVGVSVVAALAVTSIGLWWQLGSTTTGSVDLISVAFPVVALAAVSSIAFDLLGRLLHRRRAPEPQRPARLLAWRRLCLGPTPMRAAGLAVGIGFGLVVSAAALVSGFDRSITAKLATEVGGDARLTVVATDEVDATLLPTGTTLLRSLDTRVTPGGGRTRIVAVDPSTFTGAAAWPSAFGLDLADALALLDAPVDGALPAIAVTGEPSPSNGAFGTGPPLPYTVVARARSLPLAGEFGSTLLVSAPLLDEMGRRLDEASGARDEGVPYLAPTDRFRRHIVGRWEEGDLAAALGEARTRDPIDAADRRASPELVASRLGFEFLLVIGWTASLLAVAGLLLFVGARRRTSALAAVMLRSFRVRPAQIVLATAFEVTAVVAISGLGALAAAPAIVDRLGGRFEPLSDVPPTVDTTVDWIAAGAILLVLVLIAATAGGLVERRDQRQSIGKVLRDVR